MTTAATGLSPAKKYYGKGSIILPDVAIFAAGDWQGTKYSVQDLNDIVRNFYELRGTIDPPVVIGHEEDQEFTGVPAVGWVVDVRRRGTKLFADVSQLFPSIADLIDAGAYAKVSAEIYDKDDTPEGVTASGVILRRVAFLGGELPHIKSLADLPKPVRFVEMGMRQREYPPVILRMIRAGKGHTRHKVFFEAVKFGAVNMDRKALEDQLRGIGWTDDMIAALASMADPDFQTFVVAALAAQAGVAAPAAAGQADVVWPDGLDREGCILALVDMGEDRAALDAMSDQELVSLYEEKKAANMSEPTEPDGATAVTTPAPAPVTSPASQATTTTPSTAVNPSQVTVKFSELEKRAKALETRQAALEARAKADERVRRLSEANSRKALISAFCDRMVKEGKLSPAQIEVDKSGKTIGLVRARLERASAVRRFADKPSELELQMKEIEDSPSKRFSEQMADPVAKGKFAEARAKIEERIKARAAAAASGGKSLEERLRMVQPKYAV